MPARTVNLLTWLFSDCRPCDNRRGPYRDLVEKPEEKSPLGIPTYRWEMILRWTFRKYNRGMI
jgi:hypothetical protein